MSEDQGEAVKESAETATEEKPELPQREDGTYVDFADVEKVNPELAKRAERRLGYMNARMKSWETEAMKMARLNRELLERVEKLEGGTLQDKADKIKQQRQEAYDSGDMKKVSDLDDELLEIRLAEKTRKPTEVKDPEFPQEESPPLDDEQMATLASWAKETDKSGEPLRPWANPAHPENAKAIRYIEAAAMDPDYDVSTKEGFKAILETVDRKMSRGKQSKVPPVLSGNGDGRPQRGERLKITPEMARVAEGMGYTPENYAKLMQSKTEK